MIHQCDHEGCYEEGEECFLPEGNAFGEPDCYYCPAHVFEHGFCAGCGQFWSGVESFDFGNGFCDNCKGNDDGDPEEEWFDLDDVTFP
jgi:hypothetical protein